MTASLKKPRRPEPPPPAGGCRPREFPYSDKTFRKFAAIIHQRSGIHLSGAKKEMVYGRLARRVRAVGLKSIDDYCALIGREDEEEEFNRALNAITTNHTRFFREAHHFDHLTEHVLMPAAHNRGSAGQNGLRIWSAGCSRGQEPYTIALTVLATLPDAPQRDIKILATDLDTEVLGTARQATYPAETATEITPAYRSTFLKYSERSKTTVRFTRPPRSLIVFRTLNLTNPWPMRQKFDAIFCRNVLIYFNHADTEKLIRRLTDKLLPGGFLYLGHSESVLNQNIALDLVARTTYQAKS